VSKPKRKDSNIVSLEDLNEGSRIKITSAKDLAISMGDFVLERHGRFRDHYEAGGSLGSGTFGEVRK